MNQLFLLSTFVFAFLIVLTWDATHLVEARRRTGGGARFGNKERTEEKKDKKDKKEDEGDDDIDLNDLDPNATLACHKCSGPQCSDYFNEHQPGIKKVICEPGEICWKSRTAKGFFRGCATRECAQTSFDINEDFIRQHTDFNFSTFDLSDIPQTAPFLHSTCCLKDFCNTATSLLDLNHLLSAVLSTFLLLRNLC